MSAPVFTRRAMLLALGVDLPTEAVDDVAPAVGLLGTSRLHITNIQMHQSRAMGDDSPQFVAGLTRTTFSITGFVDSDFRPPELDLLAPLTFCEEFGEYRFEATMMPTSITFVTTLNALLEVRFDAVAIGPVTVTRLHIPGLVPAEDPPLLRAMRV